MTEIPSTAAAFAWSTRFITLLISFPKSKDSAEECDFLLASGDGIDHDLGFAAMKSSNHSVNTRWNGEKL